MSGFDPHRRRARLAASARKTIRDAARTWTSGARFAGGLPSRAAWKRAAKILGPAMDAVVAEELGAARAAQPKAAP